MTQAIRQLFFEYYRYFKKFFKKSIVRSNRWLFVVSNGIRSTKKHLATGNSVLYHIISIPTGIKWIPMDWILVVFLTRWDILERLLQICLSLIEHIKVEWLPCAQCAVLHIQNVHEMYPLCTPVFHFYYLYITYKKDSDFNISGLKFFFFEIFSFYYFFMLFHYKIF